MHPKNKKKGIKLLTKEEIKLLTKEEQEKGIKLLTEKEQISIFFPTYESDIKKLKTLKSIIKKNPNKSTEANDFEKSLQIAKNAIEIIEKFMKELKIESEFPIVMGAIQDMKKIVNGN